MKSFTVESGPIAPWFGQQGHGWQYQLDPELVPGAPAKLNVMWLVNNGYLRALMWPAARYSRGHGAFGAVYGSPARRAAGTGSKAAARWLTARTVVGTLRSCSRTPADSTASSRRIAALATRNSHPWARGPARQNVMIPGHAA
jgi:hypothetical protein